MNLPQLDRSPKSRSWAQFFFGGFMPMGTFTLALIFDSVPWATGTGALFLPSFALPVLFYWSVQAPRAVPMALVCLLGLITDCLNATPLGLHALAFMAVSLGAKSQWDPLAGLGLLFHWAFFALAMVSYGLISMGISLVAEPGLIPNFFNLAGPATLKLLQLVLTTIVAYPPLHLALSALKHLFLYQVERPYVS